MFDLSAFGHGAAVPQVRRDLFSSSPFVHDPHAMSVHLLEKCDGCGAIDVLFKITFTGDSFLCTDCVRGVP